jgi:hypothetical protein
MGRTPKAPDEALARSAAGSIEHQGAVDQLGCFTLGWFVFSLVMLGQKKAQKAMFAIAPLNQMVPGDRALENVRALFDEAKARIAPAFDEHYGKIMAGPVL